MKYGEMPETVGRNSRASRVRERSTILLARRARTSESARSMRAVEGQPDRSLMKKRPETWNLGRGSNEQAWKEHYNGEGHSCRSLAPGTRTQDLIPREISACKGGESIDSFRP